MMEDNYILKLEHISKRYPGVVALDDVSLELRQGEILALAGENGAGKSTLIKTCSGAVIPDSGKIIIDGKEFTSMTPQSSGENGIAIIYQEFNLVSDLSVSENIFLGRAIRKGFVIDKRKMEERSRELFSQLNIDINPELLVKDLTVGYQQMVEIAKAISQNARVLIMDEPSAPLTASEVEGMLNIVKKLRDSGVAIIYISHRLNEIFSISDRITVLRDGRKIKTVNTGETNVQELITLMVGRELKETFPARKHCVTDEVLFETKELTGNGDKNISFQVYRGEILGFGGLVGAGRTELAELIFGFRPAVSGTMYYKGREIRPKSPREAIDIGIALVPEDRKRFGAVLDSDIKGNIVMPILKKISSCSVIQAKKETEIAQRYRQEIRIKTPTLSQLVKNLSGGNQQKVIVAKWLAAEAELIILDEPTRGIDIGAKQEIYKLMNELVESGKTIILITSEMEELIGMSDRIIVLSEGVITGQVEKEDFGQERIMSYASRTNV